jgi:adenylate cyclase
MERVRRASTLGLATGVIGVLLSLVPAISSLEDTLGLRALFRLRGPLPSPSGVVVVSIDESTSARLDLPPTVRDWSRSYHARLIDRLVEHGASVIVFDLQFFRDGSADGDDALAKAIARSKRVVLVQLLERIHESAPEIWRRQDPIQAFAAGAAGLAPVPIPDTPLVSWFWTFLRTTGGEEVPTLPVVALHVGGGRAMTALVNALRSAGVDVPAPHASTPGELLAYMRDVRRRLKENASLVSQVSARLETGEQIDGHELRQARALAALYSGDAASYLNFYGPPGSVCTVPYDIVYDGTASPCTLKDATVFVGVGRSRLDRAEQVDTYHTVYQRPDGVDLSGVELHATTFANLLTGTALRPLSPSASPVLLLGVGALLGSAAYWTRTRRRYLRGRVSARVEAGAVAALLIAVYCLAAYVLFASSNYTIVPIVIPLAVQLPMALILGLLVRPVVHEEQLNVVCLVADAGGSTAVGQRLPHGAYAKLMTEYNRVLVRSVTSRGGFALAPNGDGFVSLWTLGPAAAANNTSIRLAACHAALEMASVANGFNRARAEAERLPLRIGLTVGQVSVCSDADRGVFEAVGDTVNVAARLQQANLDLGTSILALAQLVQDLLPPLKLRRIDTPLVLKGVTRTPDVCELVTRETPASSPVVY